MSDPRKTGQMQAIRLADLTFNRRQNPVTGKSYDTARVLKDEETGLEAIYVHYPAGAVTPAHTHPCAHGLLVISGLLHTQSGQFGPGDLVWYPEGSIGEHGATAKEPVTALLFTNKPFGIDYNAVD